MAEAAAGAAGVAGVLAAGRSKGAVGLPEAVGAGAAARASDWKPAASLAVPGPVRAMRVAGDDRGETLWDNAGVRLWRRADQDARIGIVSITSKMHAVGEEVMDGLLEAIARAERDLDGLVIWQPAPFAVGANLQQVSEACRAGQFDLPEKMVAKFQRTSMTIKHAQVPVVAAVQGMALGGQSVQAVAWIEGGPLRNSVDARLGTFHGYIPQSLQA